MDVHVPAAITAALRRDSVDVLTAQEDGADRLDDPELLDRATVLGRALIDIGHTSLTSKCMIRTQIQIPEPLYREVQRVAREHEWSIAEVLRRGAEVVTRTYPGSNRAAAKAWRLPPPLASELKIVDSEALRDAMEADDEAR